MKIIYCIDSVYNSGGMERVLANKANYWVEYYHYDVCIITTGQQKKTNFYSFSPQIRFIDLNVNYGSTADRNIWVKIFCRGWRKLKHRYRLNRILQQENADVCISMFGGEMSFLPQLKDGSKKILEYHFSKQAKIINARHPFLAFLQKIRIKRWSKLIRRYHAFVVLTEEDKQAWGSYLNIYVIPNALYRLPGSVAKLTSKRVISVGRLTYQKGFDRLIQAWSRLYKQYPDWQLYIFGDGPERSTLEALVHKLRLEDVVFLSPPTTQIEKEYLKSSLYVMSSRYEGFPMVLLEAMSYGLPIVSFNCPCGPAELVQDTFGYLVRDGDISQLSQQLKKLMENLPLRKEFGKNASLAVQNYGQPEIMQKWNDLLISVLETKDSIFNNS